MHTNPEANSTGNSSVDNGVDLLAGVLLALCKPSFSFRRKANASPRHLLYSSLKQLQAQLSPLEDSSFLKCLFLTKRCQASWDSQLGTVFFTVWQNNKSLGAVSVSTFYYIAVSLWKLCDAVSLYWLWLRVSNIILQALVNWEGRIIWIFLTLSLCRAQRKCDVATVVGETAFYKWAEEEVRKIVFIDVS